MVRSLRFPALILVDVGRHGRCRAWRRHHRRTPVPRPEPEQPGPPPTSAILLAPRRRSGANRSCRSSRAPSRNASISTPSSITASPAPLEDRRNWAEAIALLEQALETRTRFDHRTATPRRLVPLARPHRARREVFRNTVLEAEPGDTATITRLVNYYANRNDANGAEAVLKDVLSNPKLESTPPVGSSRIRTGQALLHSPQATGKGGRCLRHVIEALDDKAAARLSSADQNRILGGDEADAYQEFGEVFDEAKRYEWAAKAYRRG